MNEKTVRLLIVDDDPVFAQFLRHLLLSLHREFPCEPQWVESVEKAMEELKRIDYELVLLDYNLPGANGLQMLNEVGVLPQVQQPAVVMLTAAGNESVAVEAMKRGAKDYLSKSELDVLPLTRALHSALAQKQLADQVASYNEQMRADLEMARHLQESLLPDRYPCFPRTAAPEGSALRFTHRFSPAEELAGDFFSVHALSDTQAGVFICDVMGHGVRSALVTAMMRALVDNEAPRARDPGQFLAEMNRRLMRLIKPADGPLFATAFYLIVDVAVGQMRYAAAGHPRPLHLQRRMGIVLPLPVPPHAGPALGLFDGAAYATCQCPLAAEDVILIFTDGLFEVMGRDGQGYYGQQRLLAAARDRIMEPATELCDALIEGARTFASGAKFSDDVCLLAVEVVRLESVRARVKIPNAETETMQEVMEETVEEPET